MGQEVSMLFDPETGLLEINCSGSSVMLTQLEVALVYTLLKKSLGLRGRFLVWRMRKKIKCTGRTVDA